MEGGEEENWTDEDDALDKPVKPAVVEMVGKMMACGCEAREW